jgi:hypothetical protein
VDGVQTVGRAEAVALFRAGVDALLSMDLTAGSSEDLTATVVELETERRRLEAVDARVLAQVADRGVAGQYCRYSAADLLTTLLRVSPGEAKARVGRARDLGPRRALSGEVLEPIFPAVEAGEISAAHVAVITDCVDRVPPDLAVEACPVVERMLVEAARHEHPRQLAKTAALLLARLDPDGIEPRDPDPRNGFSLRKHPDGSSTPAGRWSAEVTAMWETLLDTLAAPAPAVEGMRDERSPAQRRHDAMGEAARRLLSCGELAPAGGTPLTVLATTTIDELQTGTGVARTGHGDLISISALLAMSSDAQILPVICDQAGGILAYGRGRRLATKGQRLALAARDGGCSFPGCDRPAAWTEVHHLTAWTDGGPTDLHNMCLLCRFHHREFDKRGWHAVMINNVPHWIPPAFIDPDRKPTRNTTHHLRDFDFKIAS